MTYKKSVNSYAHKRVLVTGGSGFIGSHLVRGLLVRGADVWATARSDAPRLADIRSRVRLVHVELTDAAATRRVISKCAPDIIFHAAANLERSQDLDRFDDRISETYGIAKNVLEGAVDAKVEKFIHIGTIEEYGAARTPYREAAREEPISPYSLGKTMATHLALCTARLTDLKVIVLRLAAVYGPSQSTGMLIPNVIEAGLKGKEFAMNKGEQTRDFVYIDDVVDGILLAGLCARADSEIINLGSGKGQTVKKVARIVNAAMDNSIAIKFGVLPYRPNDKKVTLLDTRKAGTLLKWHARTNIAEGLQKTVAWYRAHYPRRKIK